MNELKIKGRYTGEAPAQEASAALDRALKQAMVTTRSVDLGDGGSVEASCGTVNNRPVTFEHLHRLFTLFRDQLIHMSTVKFGEKAQLPGRWFAKVDFLQDVILPRIADRPMDVGDFVEAIMHEARVNIERLEVEFIADAGTPEQGTLSVLAHSPDDADEKIARAYCESIKQLIADALSWISVETTSFEVQTEQVPWQ